MSRERGSVTLWVLGLSLLLLLFGGISIDFWRALAVQRQLASIADAAAVAAASGIDELHYRATGEVVLDPTRASNLALASVDVQASDPQVWVTTAPDGLTVTVVVIDEVELGLLRPFIDDDAPLTVRASATAGPRLVP